MAPVIRPGVRTKNVPFPPGAWFDWWTGERIEGGVDLEVPAPLETLPLSLRGSHDDVALAGPRWGVLRLRERISELEFIKILKRVLSRGTILIG